MRLRFNSYFLFAFVSRSHFFKNRCSFDHFPILECIRRIVHPLLFLVHPKRCEQSSERPLRNELSYDYCGFILCNSFIIFFAQEQSSNVALVLTNSEPLIETAAPTTARIINVPGIGAKPAKPLNQVSGFFSMVLKSTSLSTGKGY